MKLASSPSFMVSTPSSQPLMTCPWPILKENCCCPGSLVLQNFLPASKAQFGVVTANGTSSRLSLPPLTSGNHNASAMHGHSLSSLQML